VARSWLDRLWSTIADRGGAYVSISDDGPLEQVCALARDLLSGRGEASGAAIAREMLEAVRPRVQGAYVMPPLERYELALEVIDGFVE